MPPYEHWTDAYSRILSEVTAEHPEWSSSEVYVEYRKRCALWKAERGIR